MKRIIGLDLGTTSIGWAVVDERDSKDEEKGSARSKIIKIGARVIPLTTDESADFEKGKPASVNANRTLKRGMRRNLHRYKLRRQNLLEILRENNILSEATILAEQGKNALHSLWQLRSRAATEKVSLEEFARILLLINKKRGYKSNRKAKDDDEGGAIDSMEVAKKLHEENLTPGAYACRLLQDGTKHIPDFYRSDLQGEFDHIWTHQKTYYPEVLTDKLYKELQNKNRGQTWKICEEPFGIKGTKRVGTRVEQKIENYAWRVKGLSEKLDLEKLAIVLQEINGQISGSSGLLGEISDRSKELYFNKVTIGQYLYRQIERNRHTRLKQQVFYRQDYLDEFNVIWETQSRFYPQLTDELKKKIGDEVIFYQRRLKSQKGLISICELEGREVSIVVGDEEKIKLIGPRAIPKSSPLFQEFKIWQILNNLVFTNTNTKEKATIQDIDNDLEIRNLLFEKLNVKGKLSAGEVLKLALKKPKEWELNFRNGVEGNDTNQQLYRAYAAILEHSGHEANTTDKEALAQIFAALGIDASILTFDTDLQGKAFEKQASYQLWHLLYSYEGDNSKTGHEKLLEQLKEKFGFERAYAQTLVNIVFKDEYGSLSAKAIRKILPHLKAGHEYAEACALAGYKHANSITKEENEKRPLKAFLDLLPKNSLRNPVVEKILNHMINVVNAIIKKYGKPDEIRIELARELKKSAKERKDMTSSIASATKKHEQIREKLAALYPFSTGVRITQNDVLKYKLYQELESNGYKTLYTGAYVQLEKLFSKEFEIEHIIPKTVLFDDSFSNKTLSTSAFNRWKDNRTGIDAVLAKYGKNSSEVEHYTTVVKKLYADKKISKTKYNKLMMTGSEIPDGFIDRDLRNTQYIAKKALQLLLEVARHVTPVTGTITSKLREDWQLVDVMKEINWDKYNRLGLTEYQKNKEQARIPVIKNWTKRSDHRHHAMDALTIAFTKRSHIQYFNHLNARKDEWHKKHAHIFGIEQKETFIDDRGKRFIKPPIPIDEFRAEARRQLKNVLISFKAKNKATTLNKNHIKGCSSPQLVQTPRGQLHKETVYGASKYYKTKLEKVGTKFDAVKIASVAKKHHRETLQRRLEAFDGKPKKAFGGKNSPAKNPIYLDENKSTVLPDKVRLVFYDNRFTIRKDITSDIKIDKVVDVGIQKILKKRLKDFDGDPKKAFANLDKNPIWLNEDKKIPIKRVTITGVDQAQPLHYKKDHHGNVLKDEYGDPFPVDYVIGGNNHHVAVYTDENDQWHAETISFFEAVERKNKGLPVVARQHSEHPDWQFRFTLKQNEYFVFPHEETGFDPCAVDLLDEANYALISPRLFRVRKISTGDYYFLHHLETRVTRPVIINGKTVNVGIEKIPALRNIGSIRIQATKHLRKLVKVYLNHLGEIVKVGE